MTPRERVLAAVSHAEPDRVPRNFWAEAPTWRRLLDHVGHEDRKRLLDDLGVDIRHLELPALVRGWEGMFLDMATRPEWAHFLSRKFTDFYKEDYTRAADATHGRIDLYLLISDLGSQHGPLISVPMFREFVAPYLREMIDCIHGLGGKVLFHSCGLIRPLIPDLIELGIDVLDPIQPVGPEMSPEQLKAEFGDRLSFHGGIDMQRLLPHGTVDDVRTEVRRYCDVLGRDGGYILGPAHLFQPDVPPENILATYQE